MNRDSPYDRNFGDNTNSVVRIINRKYHETKG